MRMAWDDDTPFEAGSWILDDDSQTNRVTEGNQRLDQLLPADEQTGAASSTALHVYLDSMIEMVSRGGQPLALLCVAVDETPIIRFFGAEGVRLIGSAVARCLRQETRTHDVVGRADIDLDATMPIFMVVCPLLDEEHAALLAERLRLAMSAFAEAEHPWLTLSIGVSALALDIRDARELMARSHSSMHRAQRKGGDRVWRNSQTARTIMEQQDHEPPEEQC